MLTGTYPIISYRTYPQEFSAAFIISEDCKYRLTLSLFITVTSTRVSRGPETVSHRIPLLAIENVQSVEKKIKACNKILSNSSPPPSPLLKNPKTRHARTRNWPQNHAQPCIKGGVGKPKTRQPGKYKLYKTFCYFILGFQQFSAQLRH